MTVFFIAITDDYPKGVSAGNTKVEFLCKGLIRQGDRCVIVNNTKGEKTNAQRIEGINEGIEYVQYPHSRFKNIFALPSLIKKYSKGDDTAIVVAAPDLFLFHFLSLLCKISGYKMYGLYHEYYQSTLGRSSKIKNIQARYFDSNFGYFCDGIMPISEFLIEKCQKFHKPILKVPIVANFDSYKDVPQIQENLNYFLYCGKTGYARVIYTLLDAFENYHIVGGEKRLHLVLHGYPKIQKEIELYVQNSRIKDYVDFYSNLKYEDLLNQYRNAIALFIPLDKTSVQDKARFSQKISEYLSSKRPIVTVNTGEITYYFKDGETAYVLEDFTKEQLAEKIMWIDQHPEKSNEIGSNGFNLGLKEFDYINNGEKIHEFLINFS